jgi:hypothetical protein
MRAMKHGPCLSLLTSFLRHFVKRRASTTQALQGASEVCAMARDNVSRSMPSHVAVPLTCLALLGCEAGLAHGLGKEPAAEPGPRDHLRQGCRLNINTHLATCPCAYPEDLDQLPDRDDLETIDMELAPGADAAVLDRLTRLHGLRVRNLEPQQLVRVTLLPRLDSLTIESDEAPDLSLLIYLKKLRSLTIGLTRTAHACDITPLAQLQKLEKVVLSLQCEHEIDISPLTQLPLLHEVTLYGHFSPDAAAKLPNTKVVVHDPNERASICDIDPSACPAVSACTVGK